MHARRDRCKHLNADVLRPWVFRGSFKGSILGGSGGLSKWVISRLSRLISTLNGALIGVMMLISL